MSKNHIEIVLLGILTAAVLFYVAVSFYRGQQVDEFVQVGGRHTAEEAQCDCESENAIRSHLNMPLRRCEYGICNASTEAENTR